MLHVLTHKESSAALEPRKPTPILFLNALALVRSFRRGSTTFLYGDPAQIKRGTAKRMLEIEYDAERNFLVSCTLHDVGKLTLMLDTDQRGLGPKAKNRTCIDSLDAVIAAFVDNKEIRPLPGERYRSRGSKTMLWMVTPGNKFVDVGRGSDTQGCLFIRDELGKGLMVNGVLADDPQYRTVAFDPESDVVAIRDPMDIVT